MKKKKINKKIWLISLISIYIGTTIEMMFNNCIGYLIIILANSCALYCLINNK